MRLVILNKILLVILTLIGLRYVAPYLKELSPKDDKLTYKKNVFLIKKSAKVLESLWKTGKLYGELPQGDCEQYFANQQYSSDPYYRCNPYLFQCLFEGKFTRKLSIKHADKEYIIQALPLSRKRFFRSLSPGSSSNLSMEVDAIQLRLYVQENVNTTFDLIFENTCHMKSLPLRRFIHGTINYSPNPKTNDSRYWTWDNIGRDIFIDKYLVTFRDFKIWIDSLSIEQRPLVDIPKDPNEWRNPVFGVSFDLMTRYCQSRGKQVMQSSIYDAASNYALMVTKPYKEVPERTWFPWGLRQENHFLRKVTDENDFRYLNEKNCKEVYASECLEKFKRDVLPVSSPSWIGIQQQFGGYMEAMRNAQHPKKNIFPSSIYIPMSSSWHENGVRGSWNGENDLLSSFSFESGLYNNLVKSENIKVGFRCFKDMPGEF